MFSFSLVKKFVSTHLESDSIELDQSLYHNELCSLNVPAAVLVPIWDALGILENLKLFFHRVILEKQKSWNTAASLYNHVMMTLVILWGRSSGRLAAKLASVTYLLGSTSSAMRLCISSHLKMESVSSSFDVGFEIMPILAGWTWQWWTSLRAAFSPFCLQEYGFCHVIKPRLDCIMMSKPRLDCILWQSWLKSLYNLSLQNLEANLQTD